jgi:cytoskeleton protein RodZ
MSSIGETLRRERIRRNLDLDQISRELKISSRFLEAIEAERFDRLPAGVFAKSFVRQYAGLLELDGEELAAEVQQRLEPAPLAESAAPDVPPIPEIHVPRVEQWDAVSDRRSLGASSWLPAAALVVVVMLVCSGVYSFWQRSRRPAVTTAQTTAAPAPVVNPPVQQAQPQQQAETPPAPTISDGAPPVKPAAPINPEPSPVAAASNPSPPAPVAPPTGNPPAQSGAAPNSEASRVNPNAQVKLQLTTAEEPVWVLARADGKYLFSGTLEANQTRSIEGNDAVTLRIGNAGGVTIMLNGKPIGALGPKGQVREVQFTSGGFHIVAAPKPSLPLENPL